jgi:hypothetical protein
LINRIGAALAAFCRSYSVALLADDDKQKDHSAPPPKAAPPADASAPTKLSEPEQQASHAEQEVVGQTADQVVSILGPAQHGGGSRGEEDLSPTAEFRTYSRAE